jgi:hypothetical protein
MRIAGFLRAACAAALVGLALAAVTVTAASGAGAVTPAAGSPAYWLVASDGGIITFGGAPFEGSAGALHLGQPIVGMAATPSGRGYWLVAADGGVFSYGDAAYAGSTIALPPASRPTAPIVGIVATPSGHGYWVAAANGSVYAFGDAGFFGSMGGSRLVKPIVAIATTSDGAGYWLAASDGGIFAFGDARFAGSAGAIALARPVVGMAATADGGGYWLVASDGGIFNYGDAAFAGSTGAIKLNQPIVGMASSPDGGGYWLVASDGGIFAFGDAPYRGSTGAIKLNRPIVGMAAAASLDPYPPGSTGYDISWPQCGGGALPPAPFAFAVVGVNDGRALTHNPCLSDERAWGEAALLSAYINLNGPPTGDPAGFHGPAGQCATTDPSCYSYNFGYNAALDAYAYGIDNGLHAGLWWIDVETANTWDSNQAYNARTIQGAIDALSASGVQPGIYSTSHQFSVIAGAYFPGVPVWVATGSDYPVAVAFCDPSHGFGGGKIYATQYGDDIAPGDTSAHFDRDYACPQP